MNHPPPLHRLISGAALKSLPPSRLFLRSRLALGALPPPPTPPHPQDQSVAANSPGSASLLCRIKKQQLSRPKV